MEQAIRINKYLAERGICSRRAADKLIDDGQVFVDGKKATKGMTITGDEKIQVNGKLIMTDKPQSTYFAFHKPVGILSSVDPNGRDTIATFLHLKERLFHVGRLDVASSGLLLLTNDGQLSEAITHPKGNHEKEYIVTVNRALREKDLEEMRQGMMILGAKTKKAQVTKLGSKEFNIVLTEGRNRQIRRMCEALGYQVKKLHRIRVMNINLGELASGKIRALTKKEVSDLKKHLGL